MNTRLQGKIAFITFVAGSAIFNTPNYEEVIQKMRAELALARP